MLAASLGWGRGVEILAGNPGERAWETDAARMSASGAWIPAAIGDVAREACSKGFGGAALEGLLGPGGSRGEAFAEPPPGFYTALGFASLNGHAESVSAMLLNLKLMDVDSERLPRRCLAVLDGVEGAWAEEALVFAVECGHAKMAKALLDGGACGESKAPALRRAIELGAEEMVEALLSSGVDPNIEVGAELGEDSALSFAMSMGSDKALAMLLSRGADAGALLRHYGEDGESTFFAETVGIRAIREGRPAAALLAATEFSDDNLGRLAYWEAASRRDQEALAALEAQEDGRYACSSEPERVVAYQEKDQGAQPGSAVATWVGRNGVLAPAPEPSQELLGVAWGEAPKSGFATGFDSGDAGDGEWDEEEDQGEREERSGEEGVVGGAAEDFAQGDAELEAVIKRLDAMEAKIDGMLSMMERVLALAEHRESMAEESRAAELGATADRARLRVAAAAGVARKTPRLANGGAPQA